MSFITRRPTSPYWWYFWNDAEGVKHGKSLRTESKIAADIKKGEEDKKRYLGEVGVPYTGTPWAEFKRDFLKGYKPDSRMKVLYEQTFQKFESFVHPAGPSKVTYKMALDFKSKLSSYVSKVTKRRLDDDTVNIHLRNIRAAFNEAKRMNLITKNPFDDVREIPVTRTVPRYLTLPQIKALKVQAKKSFSPDAYTMLMFFLYTGVRIGELVNLKWESIDLTRGLFFLHAGKGYDPKDREERAIGLHHEIVRLLKKKEHDPTGYVFPGRSGRRDKDDLRHLFNKLMKRAGVPYTGCHVLRHTFATHFGGSARALQTILGHSDLKTTERYRHVRREELEMVRNFEYK